MINRLLGIIHQTKTHVNNLLEIIRQPNPLDISTLTYLYPFGLPTTSKPLTLIGRLAYISMYDPEAKIPACVCYTLTPDHAIGKIARSNAFAPDMSLPVSSRATLADYENAGIDRGHNQPDEDANWSVDTERQSFYLSNITPQNKKLNENRWKILEIHVRAWAHQRNNTLAVMTGPIYDATCKTIGVNKVVMPWGYFKIITDIVTKETLAFEYQNVDEGNTDPAASQTTVAEIEAKTGFTFSIPNGNKMDKPAIWDVDLSKYNAARK